jgi:hypothetical protein
LKENSLSQAERKRKYLWWGIKTKLKLSARGIKKEGEGTCTVYKERQKEI